MSDPIVEVVSAVIIKDGRILLTQRRADQDFPLTWEAPGGKVDGDESHHEALRRELAEELGVTVASIGEHTIWCGDFKNLVQRGERAHVFVLFYPVELADVPSSRRLVPLEGQGLGWFTGVEMAHLRLAPANVEARKKLLARMGCR